MKIFVNGKEINLSQQNYVTKGGEGSIYKKGGTAFKIYEELKKMIPLAKIGELNQLDHPSIVRPQNPIYNEQKHLIGFTMDWLGGNMVALCKLFTNNFRDNNGITSDSTIELVENIKNGIHFVHQKKCLIVDGNELNYMVADDFVTPYFIDVNCWQTPSFPPDAIMPSIRDWTTDKFTEVTDWFYPHPSELGTGLRQQPLYWHNCLYAYRSYQTGHFSPYVEVHQLLNVDRQ